MYKVFQTKQTSSKQNSVNVSIDHQIRSRHHPFREDSNDRVLKDNIPINGNVLKARVWNFNLTYDPNNKELFFIRFKIGHNIDIVHVPDAPKVAKQVLQDDEAITVDEIQKWERHRLGFLMSIVPKRKTLDNVTSIIGNKRIMKNTE